MDTSNRTKSSRRPATPKKNETTTATKRPAPARARLAPKPADAPSPTHQQIAERAYLIHLSRGSHHGSPAEDWLQAERELIAERAVASGRKRTSRA